MDHNDDVASKSFPPLPPVDDMAAVFDKLVELFKTQTEQRLRMSEPNSEIGEEMFWDAAALAYTGRRDELSTVSGMLSARAANFATELVMHRRIALAQLTGSRK